MDEAESNRLERLRAIGFQKGKSGNPGGRSKLQTEFEKRCREFMSETGWIILIDLINRGSDKIKMQGIEFIANRGFGRPKENVEYTERVENQASPEEIAGAILDAIGGEASGSPPNAPTA